MKYATLLNGFTAVNLTKLDVLTGCKTVKIGTKYVSRARSWSIRPLPSRSTPGGGGVRGDAGMGRGHQK